MGSSSASVATAAHPAWTAHVDRAFEDRLGALFEAGEAVQAVQLHPGWGYVQRLLRAEITSIEEKLETTLLPSRADYARLHGRLSGLKATSHAAEAILSRSQKRLAEQRAKHERGGNPSQEA